MSKKPPAKRGTRSKLRNSPKKKQPDNEIALPSFDWPGVFPTARIKTQIQTVDPDLGCLPQKSLLLIKTCSALLLRKVVQASSQSAQLQGSNSTASEEPKVLVLSADNIQEGCGMEERLGFLSETIKEAVQTEDNKIAQRKHKKQKRPEKVIRDTLGVSKDCLDVAVQVAKAQESVRKPDSKIIMDEEDYD